VEGGPFRYVWDMKRPPPGGCRGRFCALGEDRVARGYTDTRGLDFDTPAKRG